MTGRLALNALRRRWWRRFSCCRSSPSSPRRSAPRASSACLRTRGRCAGGDAFFNDISWRVTLLASLKVAAFTTLISVVAGTAAALGIARSAPRARALADEPVPGPRGHAGDRARRRALQHGARHGPRRHDDRAGHRAHDARAAVRRAERRRLARRPRPPAARWRPPGWARATFTIFRTVTLPLIAARRRRRRGVRVRHVVRRGRAVHLSRRADGQDAAGAHLGGDPRSPTRRWWPSARR